MHFDRLKRREFVTLLGGAAVTLAIGWPRSAAKSPDYWRSGG
jgi:hypothetical protein